MTGTTSNRTPEPPHDWYMLDTRSAKTARAHCVNGGSDATLCGRQLMVYNKALENQIRCVKCLQIQAGGDPTKPMADALASKRAGAKKGMAAIPDLYGPPCRRFIMMIEKEFSAQNLKVSVVTKKDQTPPVVYHSFYTSIHPGLVIDSLVSSIDVIQKISFTPKGDGLVFTEIWHKPLSLEPFVIGGSLGKAFRAACERGATK